MMRSNLPLKSAQTKYLLAQAEIRRSGDLMHTGQTQRVLKVIGRKLFEDRKPLVIL